MEQYNNRPTYNPNTKNKRKKMKIPKVSEEVRKPEKIACAAVKFHTSDWEDDFFILTGKRHSDIMAQAIELGITKDDWEIAVGGFITTRGRFLDRRRAKDFARGTGQIKSKTTKEVLYSEDIWPEEKGE